MTGARSAFTSERESSAAASALVTQLAGSKPRAVLFFAGVKHDGEVIGRALEAAFEGACVVGCSTNGEFSDHGFGHGGASAIALGEAQIGRCAVTLADVGSDIDRGIAEAAATLSARLDQPLAKLDPSRFAAVALLEGAKGREERINEALGNVAPFLPFVGGSAADDMTFTGTWAYADGRLSADGTALLVAESNAPFRALKTCHFAPTDRQMKVTRTDPRRRLILELDGEPAAGAFARALGVEQASIGQAELMANPLGLMIDGEPWLRSCVRLEGDALFCACSVALGAELHLMRPLDLVDDLRQKLDQTRAELGGSFSAGVLWNCAYRMVEAQLTGKEPDCHRLLSQIPHAGMHSNGESYLGHINQTLTGLVWG